MPLTGKKLLIIGGDSEIGRATAAAAVEQGARVTVTAQSEQDVKDVQAEILEGIEAVVLDIRDPREMDYCFEQIGGFTDLVVVATEGYRADFLACEPEEARKVFDAKFWGPYMAVREAVPFLEDNGSITLFSGVAAVRPIKGLSILAAANSAVEALVRNLAVELSPLRVNAVAPGLIVTHSMEDERKQSVLEELPVRRLGDPADVARAVLFLVENQYTTGTVLRIDGGRSVI